MYLGNPVFFLINSTDLLVKKRELKRNQIEHIIDLAL